MTGTGNSRHIASFYCDILQEINMASNQSIAASKVRIDYPYFLNYAMSRDYMVVLVSDGESYYIQDPTNKLIYSTNGLLESNLRFGCNFG